MTKNHLTDTSSIENAVAYRIHHASRLLRYTLNQFMRSHDMDVSLEQWFILFRLYERPGQAQNELADKDLQDYPNITRLIDGLEKRGLVRREADPNDRRRSLIYLTDDGRQFMTSIFPAVLEERERLFAGISEAEIEMFVEVLDKIEQNIRQ